MEYYVGSRRKGTFYLQRRKADWIGHILLRNCLFRHVTEGKQKGIIVKMGRRGRIGKQLLNDIKEKKRYWKLKLEVLARTLWKTDFGRGYGPVVMRTEW
jgi:hypothetical protein